MTPTADLAAVQASHHRLLTAIDSIDDDVARRPSLLPGWDVAMVLTHLARHADGQVHVIEGALRGERRARYPGFDARDADIEAARGASATTVADDLRAAVDRLDAAYGSLPDDVWATATGERVPGVDTEPLAGYPFQRWREVEVHHADLGVAYGSGDWPVALVERWLPDLLPTLPDRSDTRALAAWILGRGEAPELGPWR